MKTKTFPIIGTKSSLLWDESTDAWVYLSGEPVRSSTPRVYHQIIPTLFRSVDIRANAIANLPWKLMKGETEFETSEDYENKTGLISNMYSLLYLIEASLVLSGSAYWKQEKNPAGFSKLRHLDPTSMKLDEKKAAKGIIEWKRDEPQPKIYTPKEILYFWYPDPYVEIGPPASWPAKTALAACGVLANMDEFARNYFGRGAIKAMLFSMQGASRETASEFESWWNKYITGIKNAFTTKVLNAETVTPVVVGEGIQELAEVTLSQEKREEIAIALSIPMSILFANAANYATANQDKRNWYEDKIIPEAKWIASILNEQIFDMLGLRFVFNYDSIDIMQEDEKERSMALGYLFNAEVPLDIAMRILGFELDEEDWKRIEKQVEEKEKQAEELVGNLIEGGNQQNQGAAFQPEDPKDKPEPFVERGKAVIINASPEGLKELENAARNWIDPQQLQRELSLWQNKCLKAVKRGETAASVAFVPIHIPLDRYEIIVGGLEAAETDEEIKKVFASAFRNEENSTNLNVADKMRAELRMWQEKAKKGESVDFEHEAIPETLAAAIEGSLEEAKTEDEISAVFADIWMGYP